MKLILQNQTGQKISEETFQIILDKLLTCNSWARPRIQPVNLQKMNVELLLTNDAEIQDLNKQYRQKDAPTDVLSFPLDEDTTGGSPTDDSLGQIVISLETAARQAHEQGHSFEHELKFLFAHGLLHLLGYDHQNPEDEKIMFAKTDELLT